MVETNEVMNDQYAGLLHHRMVGGNEYTLGVGIGTLSDVNSNKKGSISFELRNKSRASTGLDTTEARVDFYQYTANEIAVKLTGAEWKGTDGKIYKYEGYIIVGNDGIYAKYGANASKKIT